jgi:hypothetical protein
MQGHTSDGYCNENLKEAFLGAAKNEGSGI